MFEGLHHFRYPVLRGAGVASTSDVRTSAALLILIAKYEVWVTSSVIMFIPNFAKICQMVHEMKEGNIPTAW